MAEACRSEKTEGDKLEKNGRKILWTGIALLAVFVLWTVAILTVDVRAIGVNGTEVGFATLNGWFHGLTGVNWTLYTVTDWLGLVPFAVCVGFACLGFVQLIRRKSLLKVDRDILALGCYYILVVAGYLVFEAIPINYRPVLIDGCAEVSYPSSTTLLVLSVMPTLIFECNRRVKHSGGKTASNVVTAVFTAFMVVGRLLSGVHWITDIIGGMILSAGLFLVYRAVVMGIVQKN